MSHPFPSQIRVFSDHPHNLHGTWKLYPTAEGTRYVRGDIFEKFRQFIADNVEHEEDCATERDHECDCKLSDYLF